MKRLATFSFVLAFASAGSTALAEQVIDQVGVQNAKPQPVQMTDAQLDSVAAGLLDVTVVAIDVVDASNIPILNDWDVRILNNSANNNNVQVPVAASVGAAVAVLGNAAALARTFGRQVQNN